MPATRPRRAPLAFVALVAAYVAATGLLVQPVGCTQTAHYAFVRALARGEADIDRYHWQTCDKAYTDGHFYSVKAPALDFLTVPYWAALRAVGAVGDPLPSTESPAALFAVSPLSLWPLTLWAAVLPAALLLVAFARVAHALEPGVGAVAAVTLGTGTMILPFSTLLFGHVAATAFGFAAFAILFLERRGAPRLGLVALAGAVAGTATLTEYPLALVAAALFLYQLRRPRLVARSLAFAGAGLLALAPLAVYNLWAFGTVRTLSYANAVIHQGQSGHDVVGAQAEGFFGVTTPDVTAAASLLASEKGLLTLSPVLALGVAGLGLLARRGHRREAALVAGLGLAFLVYNAAYYLPFGGDTPGPRFLVPVLPFLMLPAVAWFRRFPGPAFALAAVSVLFAVVATATQPMLGTHDSSTWFELAAAGRFAETLLDYAGVPSGWPAISPFFLLVACVWALALARAPRPRLGRRDGGLAVAALAVWAVGASVAPPVIRSGTVGAAAVLVALAGVLAAAWISVERATSSAPPVPDGEREEVVPR